MLVSSISGIGYCPLWPLLGESPRLWKASSSLGVSSGGGLRLYGAFRVCELGRGMCISVWWDWGLAPAATAAISPEHSFACAGPLCQHPM